MVSLLLLLFRNIVPPPLRVNSFCWPNWLGCFSLSNLSDFSDLANVLMLSLSMSMIFSSELNLLDNCSQSFSCLGLRDSDLLSTSFRSISCFGLLDVVVLVVVVDAIVSRSLGHS